MIEWLRCLRFTGSASDAFAKPEALAWWSLNFLATKKPPDSQASKALSKLAVSWCDFVDRLLRSKKAVHEITPTNTNKAQRNNSSFDTLSEACGHLVSLRVDLALYLL
jgi:hypothetical protein